MTHRKIFCYNKTMSKHITKKRYCNVPGCTERYKAGGLCVHHYNMSRYKKNADIRKYMTTKGFVYTGVYTSYMNMIQRCYNKNNILYKYYGGRGIRVCDRWLDSFDNFFKDMGDREYRQGIDRIDNEGNYEPGNCRWTTQAEQNRNKRYRGIYVHNDK